jgi:tripartite motif-containing protein 71
VGQRCPSKFAVNSKGEIFSADWGIQRIEAGGAFHIFPARGGKGVWSGPGVAIGPKDEVIVLSQEANAVCVFGPDARAQLRFGEKGTNDGQLSKPRDIACDATGRMYIADTDNNRIAIFGPDGKFVANAGVGQLEKPVAVEADVHGALYVIQEKKPGLVKLAKQDNGYGAPAPVLQTQKQPLDVTSDSTGRVYVSVDADPGLIVLSPEGSTVASLAKWGDDSLKGIPALGIDRRGSLVCVTPTRGFIRIPLGEIH